MAKHVPVQVGDWMMTRLLFRQLRVGYLVTVGNGILYFILGRQYLPATTINIWFAVFAIVYIVRGFYVLGLARIDDWDRVPASVNRRRKLINDIGTVMSGCIWGSVGFFLSNDQPLAFQTFSILLIAGMSAGVVGSTSYSLLTFGLFAVPAQIPFLVHFLMLPQTEYRVCALLVLFFIVFLFLLARNLNEQTMRALQLTLEKNSLSADRDVHEAASRAKSVFLARVSHEIRTPLAAVTGYTDLLLANPQTPTQVRRDLEVVSRNGKHLTSLVNDLLDLGKIESGAIPIEKCWMSAIEQVSDALQIIRSSAERKNLRISVQYAKNVPDRIYSDPNRFHQIVLNLLTNAIKFTVRGSVHIEVLFDDQLRVRITDTGIGIPVEMRDRIFEPFVRGENEAALNQPGSGLGLALASELSTCLGGKLRLIKSQVGVGSTFELAIWPEYPVETVGHPIGREQDENWTKSLLANKNVLVVEDDPDLQELISRQIFQLGAHVDVCSNGAECLERFSDKYDVVLMDIQMPVMTGDLAARHLRQRGYKGPIIAVTAHGSMGDHRLAIDSGCTDYLSKPFEFNTLLQVVARTLKPAIRH